MQVVEDKDVKRGREWVARKKCVGWECWVRWWGGARGESAERGWWVVGDGVR